MNKTTENIIPLNQKERQQAKRKAIIFGLLSVACFSALIFTGLLERGYNVLFPAPTPIPDPAAQAVEAGVTAYATFEYNEDGNTDAWAERICAVSTEVTCEYVKTQVAPGFIKSAQQAKRGISVISAQALKKVDENPAEDIAQQIWAVKYSVDFWNGEMVEKTDYVIVTQEDGAWKFDNFVPLPQEILDQLYGPKLTPQAPTQETPQP